MYVARVRLLRFRGFTEQVIMPGRQVVVVGEPRAGSTDLITGLRRGLDPRSAQNPDLDDLHRPLPELTSGQEPAVTEVEVTLLGLGELLSSPHASRSATSDDATQPALPQTPVGPSPEVDVKTARTSDCGGGPALPINTTWANAVQPARLTGPPR